MAKSARPTSPAAYIASLEEPRRSEIDALHKLISRALPQLEPWFAAGIIGYGRCHYKYASGREGDAPVVALSSRKQYISVYVCAVEDGKYLAESRKADLPKADIGKSCIRFKRTSDIDLNALERLVKDGARILTRAASA